MPFYRRTRAPRPLWHFPLAAASLMLLWGAGVALGHARSPREASASALGVALYLVALAVLAGLVTGAVVWALRQGPLRQSLYLRWLAGTAAMMVYLALLTIAAGLTTPAGPWAQVTRTDFRVSTLLLSVLFGWVVARDPFGLTRHTERVYLTPAAFAALPASERERLTLDSDDAPGPRDSDSAA